MVQQKKRILVADDDVDYLFQLKLHLEGWGYDVISAESQQEAEQILESLKPDLAIFDLMMENEDSGFILAHRLKTRYPDIPLVISTAVTAETGLNFGVNSEEDRSWIKADLYLEKGVRPEQLKLEIEKLID